MKEINEAVDFFDDGRPRIREIEQYLSEQSRQNLYEKLRKEKYILNPRKNSSKIFVHVSFLPVNRSVDRSVYEERFRHTVALSSGRYAMRLEVNSKAIPKIASVKMVNYYGQCKYPEVVLTLVQASLPYLVKFFPNSTYPVESGKYNPLSFGIEIQKHTLYSNSHKKELKQKSGLNWHSDIAHCHNDPVLREQVRMSSKMTLVYYPRVENVRGGELLIRRISSEDSNPIRIVPKTNKALIFTNSFFEHMVNPIQSRDPLTTGYRETVVMSFGALPTSELVQNSQLDIDYRFISDSYNTKIGGSLLAENLCKLNSTALQYISRITAVLVLLKKAKGDTTQIISLLPSHIKGVESLQTEEDAMYPLALAIWRQMIATDDLSLCNDYDRAHVMRAIIHGKVGFWSENVINNEKTESLKPVENAIFKI